MILIQEGVTYHAVVGFIAASIAVAGSLTLFLWVIPKFTLDDKTLAAADKAMEEYRRKKHGGNSSKMKNLNQKLDLRINEAGQPCP